MLPSTLLVSYQPPLGQPTSRPAWVQYNLGAVSGSSHSFTLSGVGAAGRLLLAVLHGTKLGGAAPTVSSLSSSPALTWNRMLGNTVAIGSNSHTYEVWYARSAAATDYAMSATWSAAPTSALMEVHEFSAVDATYPFAVTGPLQSGVASSAPTGNVVSPYSNSLLFCGQASTSSNAGPVDSTGWTLQGSASTGSTPTSNVDNRYHNIDNETFPISWNVTTNWYFAPLVLKGTGGGAVVQPTTTPVLGQSTVASGTAASYTNPVTSTNGEYILVFAHRCFTTAGASDTVSSVTDARGNTYSLLGRKQIDGTSHQTMEVWGARNTGTSGTFNVTITWNSAGDRGSSVTASYTNVNTLDPTGSTPITWSTNDSTTGNHPSVINTNPFAHSRALAIFGSTQDQTGNNPDALGGYGAWGNINQSTLGTGTTASRTSVAESDAQTALGPVTVSDSGDSLRFYIWGSLFLKGT